MPIVIPVDKRVVCFDDESYSVPVAILDEKMLRPDDEELIEALAFYKPRCVFKEGDLAELRAIPKHLETWDVVPNLWKVRFVITKWAWHLVTVATQYGGGITLSQVTHMLEKHHELGSESSKREALIYAHGYPHGKSNKTVAWFKPHHLKKLLLKEDNAGWQPIVEEFRAEYLGYDTNKFPTRFTLDLAPDNYQDGRNLERPFVSEEPLVNTMYDLGMEELINLPRLRNERNKAKRLDRDHEVYYVSAEDE